MTLPDAVVDRIGRRLAVGDDGEAFLLLTVDEDGHPHVCLLSAAETDVGEGGELLVALASRTTRANLVRDGRATFVAVAGGAAHYLKLRATKTIEAEGLLGAALEVVAHKVDAIDTPLHPIRYRVSEDLVALEQWDRTFRVLAALRA